MSTNERKTSPSTTGEAMKLLKVGDVCKLLGGIHPRTLSRMTKRGLIQPVSIIRHKLYSREAVESLVKNNENWSAQR